MNPSGALLILAGLWAVVQLVKGDALARLGLTNMGPARASTLQQEGPMVGVASSAQSSAAIQAVIRQALALQGTPYANPSNPPATLDCSSFVSLVYKRALDKDLIPLTFTQVGYGASVPIGPQYVQPGDLVFTADSEGRQFGHVGIALDANTKIHAPHTGDVVRTAPINWGSVQAVRRLVTS
jgi:peptidoglycan DL-endopeptidase CwlO